MTAEEPSAVRDVKVCRDAGGRRTVTVRLAGEVDLHHSPAVRNELIRLADDRPENILIDLAGVAYMDSSGVATLVEALQHVRRYGGRLVLVAPSARVKSLFQIARLDSVFQIVASAEEAQSQQGN